MNLHYNMYPKMTKKGQETEQRTKHKTVTDVKQLNIGIKDEIVAK